MLLLPQHELPPLYLSCCRYLSTGGDGTVPPPYVFIGCFAATKLASSPCQHDQHAQNTTAGGGAGLGTPECNEEEYTRVVVISEAPWAWFSRWSALTPAQRKTQHDYQVGCCPDFSVFGVSQIKIHATPSLQAVKGAFQKQLTNSLVAAFPQLEGKVRPVAS